MIPILYENTETAFTTNGLGRLNCIRCIVPEERNGIYECEFDLPVSDPMFEEVKIGRIIACTHDEEGDVQPFDIYKKSEPINGVVTFYASHISYRLNEITVEPFTALSCSAALTALKDNSVGSNPFTFTTDKAVTSQYTLKAPASLRGLLAGQENSILDVYGKGEYVFDKFNVALYVNRGTDTEVSIRYGKNLAEYQDELDYSACYNGVVPYWLGEVSNEETGDSSQVLVTLTEKYISSGQSLPSDRLVLVPMDLSGEFSEQPTEAQLRTRAISKLSNSSAWLPSQNITVNFVQLWQTEEYKDLAPLEKVKLCDTVLVDVPMYNVSGLRIKVIKVTWNVLLERYDSMELGTAQSTLASTIGESLDIGGELSEIRQEVYAAGVVSGNTNQHFWFTASGGDTGAHITEVTREEFLNDPSNGGGNLIARSNGIAVRNGLTEMASFSENNIVLGRNAFGHGHATFTDASIIFTPNWGSSDFNYARQREVSVNQIHIGDGVTRSFVIFRFEPDSLSVTINGTATAAFDAPFPNTEGVGSIMFTTAPAAGAVIEFSYTTNWTQPYYSFGVNTISAPYGYAEGRSNTVDGVFGHAEGYKCKANGAFSHAQNYGTIASGEAQTAIGKYNIEDTDNAYALIVGKGSSTTRSNAMTVAWNGNTVISGTLTQSSDKRLKKHLDYLDENADEFIRELKPAHYIKDDEHHVGFYAQDVEKADKWDCMVGEMNGYKTLGYAEIIAPLVAYCQHLEKRIEALEREKK